MDTGEVNFYQAIKDSAIDRIYAAMNTLYEAVFDTAAPNNGGIVQSYAGHDHGVNGGIPITRGLSYSEDSGAMALFHYVPQRERDIRSIDSFTPNVGRPNGRNDRNLFRFYGSYNIDTLVSSPVLDGWICYQSKNSNFRLVFRNASDTSSLASGLGTGASELSIVLPPTGNSVEWVNIPGLPVVGGAWNGIKVFAENENFERDNPPYFSVFALVFAESPQLTLVNQGLET